MWFNPLLKITSASFHAVRVASIYKKNKQLPVVLGIISKTNVAIFVTFFKLYMINRNQWTWG